MLRILSDSVWTTPHWNYGSASYNFGCLMSTQRTVEMFISNVRSLACHVSSPNVNSCTTKLNPVWPNFSLYMLTQIIGTNNAINNKGGLLPFPLYILSPWTLTNFFCTFKTCQIANTSSATSVRYQSEEAICQLDFWHHHMISGGYG